MATISERLRLQFGYSPHARSTVPECWQQALTEAADTIDALVAALDRAKASYEAWETMDVFDIDAALARARK